MGPAPGRERGVHRFDEQRPAPDLRHRHPAADGVGLAPRGPRLQLHADRRAGPLPADARARTSSTRWAGTTTGCPPSGGSRTTTTCAASPACPYEPDLALAMADEATRKQPARRDLARELHRAVPRAHRRGREGVQGAVAAARALGGLGARVLDDQRPQPRAGAVELPRPAPPGPRLPGRGPDAVGRGLPHRGGPGRGRGPPAEGGLPPRALRGGGRGLLRDRHHAPGAAARVRGGGGAPRRRALPGAVRQAGGDAAVPRAGADLPERRSWTGRRGPGS